MELISPESRASLARVHEQAAAQLENLERALDETPLDASLLDMTQRYVRAMLRGKATPAFGGSSARDDACRSYCDQFMASVAHVEDAQIETLRQHMSADEIYLYANAVYLIEMSARLDLTMESVLA